MLSSTEVFDMDLETYVISDPIWFHGWWSTKRVHVLPDHAEIIDLDRDVEIVGKWEMNMPSFL